MFSKEKFKNLQEIDFRNCKYQGETNQISDIPHGFGLALDENYTTVFAKWDSGKISHMLMTVFGDSEFMWNHETVTIYVGEGFRMFRKKDDLVIDLREYKEKYNNTLTKFTITSTQTQTLSYVSTNSYNHQSYESLLQSLLSLSSPEDSLFNFEYYVRSLSPQISVFPPTHHGNYNEVLLSLGDFGNSIELRFSKKMDFKLLKVCTSEPSEELCRKYQYYYSNSRSKAVEGYVVEEMVNVEPKCYMEFEYGFENNFENTSDGVDLLGRSDMETQKQCIKNLQEYYKRSLNFHNKFLTLGSVYHDRNNFKAFLKEAIQIIENASKSYSMNISSYAKTPETKKHNQAEWKERDTFGYGNQKYGHERERDQVGEYQNEKEKQTIGVDDWRREIAKVEQVSRSRDESVNRSRQHEANRIHNNNKISKNEHFYQKQTMKNSDFHIHNTTVNSDPAFTSINKKQKQTPTNKNSNQNLEDSNVSPVSRILEKEHGIQIGGFSKDFEDYQYKMNNNSNVISASRAVQPQSRIRSNTGHQRAPVNFEEKEEKSLKQSPSKQSYSRSPKNEDNYELDKRNKNVNSPQRIQSITIAKSPSKNENQKKKVNREANYNRNYYDNRESEESQEEEAEAYMDMGQMDELEKLTNVYFHIKEEIQTHKTNRTAQLIRENTSSSNTHSQNKRNLKQPYYENISPFSISDQTHSPSKNKLTNNYVEKSPHKQTKQMSKIGATYKNMSEVSTYSRSNSSASFLKALKYIK